MSGKKLGHRPNATDPDSYRSLQAPAQDRQAAACQTPANAGSTTLINPSAPRIGSAAGGKESYWRSLPARRQRLTLGLALALWLRLVCVFCWECHPVAETAQFTLGVSFSSSIFGLPPKATMRF